LRTGIARPRLIREEGKTMPATAKKTDPALWEKTKAAVTRSDKGGRPGQWSARKAQLATSEYKKRGGGYAGKKSDDNHLKTWTDEKWGTASGRKSGDTGERYLPRKARESLSKEEYARTTSRKRADTRKGRQFSKQPADIARKTSRARNGHVALDALTRNELVDRARAQGITGFSRMTKAELTRAIRA